MRAGLRDAGDLVSVLSGALTLAGVGVGTALREAADTARAGGQVAANTGALSKLRLVLGASSGAVRFGDALARGDAVGALSGAGGVIASAAAAARYLQAQAEVAQRVTGLKASGASGSGGEPYRVASTEWTASSGDLGSEMGLPGPTSDANGTASPSADGSVARHVRQFVEGFGRGVAEGAVNAVTGVVDTLTVAERFVTDAAYREQVATGLDRLAREGSAALAAALSDPAGTAMSAAEGVQDLYERFQAARARAVEQGTVAEFYGRLLGRATAEGAMAVLPSGTVARVGRGAELLDAAGSANRAVELLRQGARAGEAGTGQADAVDTGAAGGAQEVARANLRGKTYEIPGWHMEEVEFTKRSPGDLALLRSKFDTNVRRDFLRDLGANHTDTLRTAGMDNEQIARIASGQPPQGYQVHHIIPLDDGGTNDFSNLVLIRSRPDHALMTNNQNAVTRGMQAGEKRTVKLPIPNGTVYIWPDKPGNGAVPR